MRALPEGTGQRFGRNDPRHAAVRAFWNGLSPEEREAFIKEQLANVEPIEPSTVHSIDWWCGKISEEGVGLRMDKSLTMRRTVSACRERGRSRRAGG